MGRRFQIHEVLLPAKREVCRRCNGEGKHVNPNIDGHGIDPQEFRDDPEFEENYFSGLYDVTCQRCNGLRVVDVVDRERLTPKMLSRLTAYERAEDDARAEALYESRVGA